MRHFRIIALLLTLCICLSSTSCGWLMPPALMDTVGVLKIAREYRINGQSRPSESVVTQVQRPVSLSTDADDEDFYIEKIARAVNHHDFDMLEMEAHEARNGRGRFVGGAWKLYAFYLGTSSLPKWMPYTDPSWNQLLTTLKTWQTARPESASARIALAEAYVNYAWYGRGQQFANKVTETQWKDFNERAKLARSTLIGAAWLNEKCPYWYEAMQHVAQELGWRKSEARELMEQAVLFEPGYYHYYREYAHYLQPRWYGAPGDAEAFAEEISNRIDGKQGAFLYFEIASLITCQCNPDPTLITNMSWPKIKEGYAALDEFYGVSNLKRNRFAYMAFLAGDLPASRAAFTQIGEKWDRETWESKQRFDTTRAEVMRQ
jgi:hypothetical protein